MKSPKSPRRDPTPTNRKKTATKKAATRAPAMDPLDEAMELMHFGFRRVVEGPDRELAKRGLGRVHHRVLYIVARNPGLSVGALIGLLGVTKQALSGPLKHLSKLGFLKAETSEENRRLKSVALTPLGARFERKISDLQRRRFGEAFSRVGKSAVSGWRSVMDDLAEGSRLRVELGGELLSDRG